MGPNGMPHFVVECYRRKTKTFHLFISIFEKIQNHNFSLSNFDHILWKRFVTSPLTTMVINQDCLPFTALICVTNPR